MYLNGCVFETPAKAEVNDVHALWFKYHSIGAYAEVIPRVREAPKGKGFGLLGQVPKSF